MIREGITYDDVLLVPQYSEVATRGDVDLSVTLPKIQSTITYPIVPANMKTIIGFEMAKEILKQNGLGILHRFIPLEEQLAIVNNLSKIVSDKNVYNHIGFSVGVKEEDYNVVDTLVDAGVKILCIDVAHGDSKLCCDMCLYISNKYPQILLIAGNVATGPAAKRLWQVGADIVKVGVGPGSLCTTRIETGNGVPQLTALMDVYATKRELQAEIYRKEMKKANGLDWLIEMPQLMIMADGGVKSAGDVVKALCFADLVMIGNMFAGTEESPGTTIIRDGIAYKEYVGSSTHKTNHIEGVEAIVPYKGKFVDILTKILEGVKSGCSYQGVSSLLELKEDPQFIRITNAGLKESNHHDVRVI